jgi:uncharacterized membrane protein
MDTIISSLGPVLIVVSLFVILAIVLFIGWIVNRQRLQNIGQLPRILKEKYDNREISKKEYEDVKREIEEPLHQLKYFLKIYR